MRYLRGDLHLSDTLVEIKAPYVIRGLRRAQQSRLDYHAAVVAANVGLLHRRKSRADLRQIRQQVHAGRFIGRVRYRNANVGKFN